MDDPPNLARPSVPAPRPSILQGVATVIGIGGPLSAADLAIFAELLVGLVRARLPLPDALRLLAGDAESRRLRESLAAVEKDVAGGMPLGEALRKREGEFPPLFTRLIDQGVASNDLHAALVELVREYRSQMKFREALWSQLLSPIATCVCLGTVVFLMIATEMPTLFKGIFRSMRVDLPLPTRLVFWLSDMLHNPLTAAYALMAVGLLVILIGSIIRSPRTRKGFQMLALSLPLIGPFLKTMLLARYCRLLSVLLHRKIPLNSALELTRDCFTFIPMQIAVESVRSRVASGETLDKALNASPLFTQTLAQFVRGGQVHGDLPETLSRMGELYEERAESYGTHLRMFIFITAQIIVGLAVALIILSFFLPMFKVQDVLRKK